MESPWIDAFAPSECHSFPARSRERKSLLPNPFADAHDHVPRILFSERGATPWTAAFPHGSSAQVKTRALLRLRQASSRRFRPVE